MHHPSGQSLYPQNGPYQPPQSYQSPRPFQQQPFGPRFQTPQQITPPGSFYQSPPQQPQQHFDHQRSPYQGPIQPRPFYQSPIANSQYLPSPAADTGFNQMPIHHSPVPIYKPIQNFSQPPPVQNYNQPPVQNYNQPPPIPSVQNYNQPPPISSIQNFNQPPPISPVKNFNQPPPIQSYNQSPTQNYNQLPSQNYNQPPPFQPANQNCHQLISSPFQPSSPRYDSIPNIPYQPQVQSPELVKQSYQLPTDQCYQQQQSSFNGPRYGINQRPPFGTPGNQRFPFKNQNPRHQQPQYNNNRFQHKTRQQYQHFRPRGPPSLNNQPKCNNILTNDKPQIICNMDNCDFIGHASAVKEHQNLHHRLGLHKKVLYSNNSEAVKNWIEERKKKWPTKETIQIKSEVEDEKNKRGERIADDDFQRFNKKKKFNHSGPKRFNNKKRPGFNGEFIEPVEEPMNGNLKRFLGIADIQKEYENTDEANKPVVLKLLEEYDESSDGEPPEETIIVKKLESFDNKSLTDGNEEPCTTSKIGVVSTEHNEEANSTSLIENVDSTSLVENVIEAVNTEVNVENCSKVDQCGKMDSERQGQKRKRNSKKESKPFKKIPPLRTPRTEVVERKAALLEALMGDLMRKERNTITQCICYIRKNMHRFCKTQAA